MKALDGIGLVVVAAAIATAIVMSSPGRVVGQHLELAYTLSPTTISEYDFGDENNQALARALGTAFGDYDDPRLPDDADWEGLGIEPEQLALGRNQFRINCMHCHGVTGGGAGPTAEIVKPKPRNFRNGVLKFTSTPTGAAPTREDITRTLRHGVAYTAMPSFVAYFNLDLEALTSYVQYLLIRGETEVLVAFDLDDEGTFEEELSGEDLQTAISDILLDDPGEFFVVQDKWIEAKEMVINPPIPRPEPTPASLARGKEVFLSARTECSACHGDDGAGRGPNVYDAKTKTFKLQDNWGFAAEPADLRKGIYRGGHRPIDLYWRISGGIHGTPMPSFADSLEPQQIWDVINYVYSIPYQEGR